MLKIQIAWYFLQLAAMSSISVTKPDYISGSEWAIWSSELVSALTQTCGGEKVKVKIQSCALTVQSENDEQLLSVLQHYFE